MPAQNDAGIQETDAGPGLNEAGHLEALASPGIITAASESAACESAANESAASESAASKSAASESAMEAAHGGASALIAAEEIDLPEAALPELEEGLVLTSMKKLYAKPYPNPEEASESEIAETHAQAAELKFAADEDAAQQETATDPGPEGTQEEGEGSPEEPAAVEPNGNP